MPPWPTPPRWRRRGRWISRWKLELEVQNRRESSRGSALIFREAGFEAATVADQRLSGTDDSVLFERCRAENRVLVTLDLDFGNVQAYPPGSHSGIVVFRSKSQDKPTLISLLKRILPLLIRRSPERQLWIVETDRIRYRED